MYSISPHFFISPDKPLPLVLLFLLLFSLLSFFGKTVHLTDKKHGSSHALQDLTTHTGHKIPPVQSGSSTHPLVFPGVLAGRRNSSIRSAFTSPVTTQRAAELISHEEYKRLWKLYGELHLPYTYAELRNNCFLHAFLKTNIKAHTRQILPCGSSSFSIHTVTVEIKWQGRKVKMLFRLFSLNHVSSITSCILIYFVENSHTNRKINWTHATWLYKLIVLHTLKCNIQVTSNLKCKLLYRVEYPQTITSWHWLLLCIVLSFFITLYKRWIMASWLC